MRTQNLLITALLLTAWVAPELLLDMEPGDERRVALRIEGVPETFYVDKTGLLRGVHIGPLTPPILDDKIEELLAE